MKDIEASHRRHATRLLGWGLLTVALATLLLASRAAAEPPPSPESPPAPVATPAGDDVSFVFLGAVGERVSIDFYRAAARAKVLDRPSRRALRRLAKRKTRQWSQLNAVLGEDALTGEDIATTTLPPQALSSPKQIFRFGERLERLMAGVYLSGLRDAADPATRMLLARRMIEDLDNLALLRGLRGASGRVIPLRPLGIEYVGGQIDKLLTTQGVEPS